jgi:uncharacterized protein YbjT (DUF2867 family)
MKIVILGGTGLIGSRLTESLRSKGLNVAAVSPSTGVDSVSGKGLADVLKNANILVDVTNSPSFADEPVMAFFRNSTAHLVDAAKAAGVLHYIALSIVGVDRIEGSGYMRAKLAQEQMIQASGIPYTILRATQFFEFLGAIADDGTDASAIYLPTAKFQPVAANDVVDVLTDIAISEPRNGTVDLAGPEAMSMAKFVQVFLSAKDDARKVIPDANAKYFGAILDKDGLAPTGKYITGPTRFADWVMPS